MPSVRRTALHVAAAVVVWTVTVVLALTVGTPAAGAQSSFDMAFSCNADENDVFYFAANWTSGERGEITLSVVADNPDLSSQQIFRITQPNGAARGNQGGPVLGRRTFIQDGATLTWTWVHASGTQTGTVDCMILPATLDDLEDRLVAIETELAIISNRALTNNSILDDIEEGIAELDTVVTAALLGDPNDPDAPEALLVQLAPLTDPDTGLGPLLGQLHADNIEQLNRLDRIRTTANVDAYRTQTAALNQSRNQTHALLALVAVMFALWLRPIFRSRKEAT